MKKQSLLLLLALSITAIGCSSNTETGAVVGSLVGAGIGKSTANHSDKRAAIGAVVGGIVGAAIGAEQDEAEARSDNDNTVASHTHDGSTHSHDSVAYYPYYPVSTSIILGNNYRSYPRYYRNRYRTNRYNRYNTRSRSRHHR